MTDKNDCFIPAHARGVMSACTCSTQTSAYIRYLAEGHIGRMFPGSFSVC